MSSISLSQIEDRFTTAVSGTITEGERKEIVGLLKTAFKEFKVKPEKDSFELAKIFYLYGRAIYGGDMVAPHNVLKLSTAFQLVGMEKLDVTLLPSIEECEELEQVAQLQCPVVVDELLMNGDAEVLGDHAEAFSFASSLRWQLHTEQNLKGLSKNLDRLEKLYGLARAIQEKVNTPDSRWEVAGIIYNGERWLVSQRDPKDIDKALAVLDRLKPFIEEENGSIRSQLVEAQTANMRAKLLGDKVNALLLERFAETSKAAGVAAGLAAQGGNKFLATLFKSNLIKVGLDCLNQNLQVTNFTELNGYADSVLSDMEKDQFSHFYYPMFLMNIAQLAIFQGRRDIALVGLNKAEEVNNNFPQNENFEQTKQTIASMKAQIGVTPNIAAAEKAAQGKKDDAISTARAVILASVITVAFLAMRGHFKR